MATTTATTNSGLSYVSKDITDDPLRNAPLINFETGWNTEGTEPAPIQTKSRDTSFSDFLSMFKCRSPVFPNESNVIVRVFETQTLGDALKKMTTHKILSLPVVDHHTGKPIYMVTMIDLVAYFVAHFSDNDFKTDFWHSLTNFFYVGEYCDEIAKQPLSKLVGVIGGFGIEPLALIEDDKTILDATKMMIDKNAHRVLVVDNTGNLVSVITQSRILQFIPSVLENSPKSNKTLRELGLGFKKVFAVREDQIVYKAFRSMVQKNLNALAVVDENDVLVGNLSITDFKLAGYQNEYWNYLGLTVKQYLKELSSIHLAGIRSGPFYIVKDPSHPHTPIQLVITAKADDTLMRVVKQMTYFRVHRIYIINDMHKPIGIITISDLLKELLEYNNQA